MTDRDEHVSLQKNIGLEKKVSKSDGMIDAEVADIINKYREVVCQIHKETPSGFNAVGTGFLVGPNHVLTNLHVVENISVNNICCRFDVKSKGPDGFGGGPLLKVTNILAQSPYSEIEASDQYSCKSDVHPSLHELDFALLEIENPNDNSEENETSSKASPRGFIALPDTAPAIHPKSLVYILQHPSRGTLKIASDTIADHQPPNEARIRYLANTEAGSSGSPCFCWSQEDENADSSLVLIAIHNFGDPGSKFKKSEFNHGIPIHLIARNLKTLGLDKVLNEQPSDSQPSGQSEPTIPKKSWLKLLFKLLFSKRLLDSVTLIIILIFIGVMTFVIWKSYPTVVDRIYKFIGIEEEIDETTKNETNVRSTDNSNKDSPQEKRINLSPSINNITITGTCIENGEPLSIAGFHQSSGSALVSANCIDGTFKVTLNHVAERVSAV